MFSVDTRILRYKEKRILLNTSNGLWIRVSQKVYNLFVLVEKEGLSFNQLLESLYDEEDREYMKSVYNKMIEIGIVEKTEGEVRGNRTLNQPQPVLMDTQLKLLPSGSLPILQQNRHPPDCIMRLPTFQSLSGYPLLIGLEG